MRAPTAKQLLTAAAVLRAAHDTPPLSDEQARWIIEHGMSDETRRQLLESTPEDLLPGKSSVPKKAPK